MNTPLDESNLDHIGGEDDKRAKKFAAETEVNWKGAGEAVGIQVWRVENKRDENDNPKFGIQSWPKKRYGEFYNGDSYIVLHTTEDEENENALQWDIYFWIGSDSSQDEYGVAAYKANELDDLLDDAPIQHRELQGLETEDFMACFPKGVRILDGGIDSGFRHVDVDDQIVREPTRLYHCRKSGKITRSFQVMTKCSSLNQGDAFVLDDANTLFTWFGTDCSPFEKSKAATIAHNIAQTRGGHCTVISDVKDDNKDFFDALGGRETIKGADEYTEKDEPLIEKTKMFVLSNEDSFMKLNETEPILSNLVHDDVCILDTGRTMYVWIGKGSNSSEQNQAMVVVQSQLKSFGRERTTSVIRVKQGQEKRVKGFRKAFNGK